MTGRAWRALKRFLLWDYERASWPYDLMVGLILAFVFLTPREWFRDQPRKPEASRIVMPPSAKGHVLYWIEPEALAEVGPEERSRRVSQLLKPLHGTAPEVVRVEPVVDSEDEVKGYVAFTKP
jgi:hypothetical protein